MKVYLGSHQPHWLYDSEVPLFVSHRTLRQRKSLYLSDCNWALDSGGFSELSLFGDWTVTADDYIKAVYRYWNEIGKLDFAAPQDWMCEPMILRKTGLSVITHQQNTVSNYVELINKAPDLPFIPVLQGWTMGEYQECIRMYEDAGIDLASSIAVGIGSICREQSKQRVQDIISMVYDYGFRKFYAFCVSKALPLLSHKLTTSTSLSMSPYPPMPSQLAGSHYCRPTHIKFAKCLAFALIWREQLLRSL